MPGGSYKFHIEKGTTFHPTIRYIDIASGTPIDLTGYKARMFIGTDPSNPTEENYFDLTTENGGISLGGTAGTILPIISDEVTAVINWKWAAYVLDLSPDGGGIWDGFLSGEVIAKDRPG